MLTESFTLGSSLTGALFRSVLQGRLDGEIERTGRLGTPLVLCISASEVLGTSRFRLFATGR